MTFFFFEESFILNYELFITRNPFKVDLFQAQMSGLLFVMP